MKTNLENKVIIPLLIAALISLLSTLGVRYIPLLSSMEYIQNVDSFIFYFTCIFLLSLLAWGGSKKTNIFNFTLLFDDVKNEKYQVFLADELRSSKNLKMKIYSFFNESITLSLKENKIIVSYLSHNKLTLSDIDFVINEVNYYLSKRYSPTHV